VLAVLAFLASGVPPASSSAAPATFDAALFSRIDAFVERERRSSGIPGIALAVLQAGGPVHVRGFGDDGSGTPIDADTPFPIGSLTKSYTALLVRQAVDTGQLDVAAPVQRYLRWFRVADPDASARITLRHLLNQTSGFSRADGISPLLSGHATSIEALARSLAAVSLNRPVGERFEYSNLNFVVLGAVLQAVTGQSWEALIKAQVFQPLRMTRSYTDYNVAQRAGMTALHRMWFGVPVAQDLRLSPALAPTGSLVASASDLARYAQMLLANGLGPEGGVVSADGASHLIAAASPPARATLLSTEFRFEYGEGWFVGPFGAATDARWHLGNLPSFAAWVVLLPDTRQAVVVLINANSELPFNQVNAVMSRLPIGVVNLLRAGSAPTGPSLRRAYWPFNAAAALGLIGTAALATAATRARRSGWAVAMAVLAAGMLVASATVGIDPKVLAAFAPDLACVLFAVGALLCVPASARAWHWAHRSRAATRESP
jgi:CubicO group peptidase (beta-lactamase class C family)